VVAVLQAKTEMLLFACRLVQRRLFTLLHMTRVNAGPRPLVVWASDGTNPAPNPPANESLVMMNRTLIAATLSLACIGAFAQTTAASTTQRDVSQQARIESGLKNGSLSTQEAARLEKEESHVDRLQARDLRNGSLSPAERAQLNAAQNKVSRDIAADTHNGVTGNPASASSRRMQADVARNISQEKRIEGGIRNGSLSNREVGQLERGQARVDRGEYRVARNGHVNAGEQRSVQRAENRQSRHIHADKNNGQRRG